MTTERDRCLDLLVTGMLGCVTFHHDIPDDRIEGIRTAMRETADSFLSVWDDSKAHGGRLIVDQTWDRAERVPAAGTELYQWVRGRAARPDESAEGLRTFEPGTQCTCHSDVSEGQPHAPDCGAFSLDGAPVYGEFYKHAPPSPPSKNPIPEDWAQARAVLEKRLDELEAKIASSRGSDPDPDYFDHRVREAIARDRYGGR